MPEFFNVITISEALKILDKYLKPNVGVEYIKTSDSLGRITAEEIRAPSSLPLFPRSTMDGYAVSASDTYGASEGLPSYLRLIGEIQMGHQASIRVLKGEAVKIHTGCIFQREQTLQLWLKILN